MVTKISSKTARREERKYPHSSFLYSLDRNGIIPSFIFLLHREINGVKPTAMPSNMIERDDRWVSIARDDARRIKNKDKTAINEKFFPIMLLDSLI